MGPRMGRIRVRAARALLPLLLLVPVLASDVPRAGAQEAPSATLELLSQTAWVGPTDDRFGLRVLARNDGSEAIEDLDVRLAIGPAFTSRFEYEAALLTSPETVIASARFPFRGEIQAGGARQFAVAVDPSTIPALTPTDSRVYPLRVEVRSGGTTVGTLLTSFVWIVRDPDRPLTFSWWTEIDAPLPLDPEGRLAEPGFEATIADGGTLTAQVNALVRLAEREVPIDVVVRPALLEQLLRMRDGYERTTGESVPPDAGGARDAGELLAALSGAAAAESVQVSAMPFAGPSIPALLSGDLQVDLEAQRQLANQWTDTALDVNPATSVARPPGGLLSDEALAWLAGRGTRTVLADADAVERPVQPNEFAVPSTATVATSRGDVALVLPDPDTQALLERGDLLVDPVRAAQAVFAELAVIWREAPVPPDQPDGTATQRGIALHLPTSLPAAAWPQLAGRLGRAPFLSPEHAQDHAATVNPAGPPTELRDPATDVFTTGYADDVRRLRRDVQAMASMFTEPSTQPARLQRNLFVAEAAEFLDDEPAGRAWIGGVAGATGNAFDAVEPELQEFTLTSREGDVPLLMGDPGEVPVRVSVELLSSDFDFPSGSVQEVVLEPGTNQVVTFSVVSRTAGRNEIRVIVRAPSGRSISEQDVFVRSTALNAIALAVTGAAAFVLLGLWLRRWVRRRSMA